MVPGRTTQRTTSRTPTSTITFGIAQEPKIVEMDRVIKKRKPQILISTEIEALVERLFLEEQKLLK